MYITPQIKAALHNSGIKVGKILPIFIPEPDLFELSNDGIITTETLIKLYAKVATDNDSRPRVFSIDAMSRKHSLSISYHYNESTNEMERHIKTINPIGIAPSGNENKPIR